MPAYARQEESSTKEREVDIREAREMPLLGREGEGGVRRDGE